MKDYRNDLVFCPINEQWFISTDENDELELIDLDTLATGSVISWVEEKVIYCVSWQLKDKRNSASKGKIYFDAWRSEQAYGKQPHTGYLKASEYGMQCNSEHFDDEVEYMKYSII